MRTSTNYGNFPSIGFKSRKLNSMAKHAFSGQKLLVEQVNLFNKIFSETSDQFLKSLLSEKSVNNIQHAAQEKLEQKIRSSCLMP
jgi:hypothetical protein